MAAFRTMAAAFAAAALVGYVQATEVPLPPCLDPFRPFVYSGCFRDTGSPQILPYRSPMSSDGMTVEKCVAECKGNGYRYAGLVYYGVCYCGQTVRGPQVEESQCNLPCNGNKTEICGGNSIFSVYQDPTFEPIEDVTIEDYHALGCYTDDSSRGRALVYRQDQVDAATLTTAKCLQACRDGGFPFAGTEFGGECYCGVVIGNDTRAAPAGECNMPCNGNSSETCGGPSRLSLFVAHELQSLEPCGYKPPVSSSTTTSTSTTTTSSTSTTSTSKTTKTTSSTTTPCTSTTTTSKTTKTTSSTTTPCTSTTTTSKTTKTTSSTTTSKTTKTTSSTTTSKTTKTTSSTTTPCTSTTTTSKTTTSKTTKTTSSTTTPCPSTTTTSSKTTKTSTTTTRSSVCVTTTVVPPTCEYKCGKWCSSPLPEWDDVKTCKQAWSVCALQVASCYKQAGWPDAIDCFDFGEWCADVSKYCDSNPRGGCRKSDFWGKKPPKGGNNPPKTITITTTCAPTATSTKPRPTTTTTPPKPTTTTKCPVPTPTNICTQPSNPYYGYGPGKPVGGIEMPVVTCNDLAEDWPNWPFKQYNEVDTRKCKKYPRNGCGNACADACKEQYEDCVEVYAEGCKRNRGRDEKNYFEFSAASSVEKRTAAWNDSWDKALQKCKAQYGDCLNVNRGVTGAGKCLWFNHWKY